MCPLPKVFHKWIDLRDPLQISHRFSGEHRGIVNYLVFQKHGIDKTSKERLFASIALLGHWHKGN